MIKVSDIVSVDFNVSRITLTHKAEVLKIPCATGDSWVFKDLLNNNIYYVSEGCTITLLGKENKNV